MPRRVSPAPLLAALAAALAAAGTAGAAVHGPLLERGIVQSVTPARIVLRELDGSEVTIPVAPTTRVVLNGVPARLADVQPGFVAAVTHLGPAPARLVRAWGRVARAVSRGAVAAVSRRSLTVRTATGETLVFRRTRRTRILRGGVPARWLALRVGLGVEVTHSPAGVALLVVVRRRT